VVRFEWDDTLWDLEIDWQKTIVIVWWNLYITSNIINDIDLDNSDILWIIVLKDENFNWWSVYIDPSVKSINWSIYADKVIMSYNKVACVDWEITPDCGWTLDVLKNQLYIKWQVFSENTIGGSRSTPYQCPYYKYIDPSYVCEKYESQKYDLNFMRRYFVYDSDSNWILNSFDDPYWWYNTTNYFPRNSTNYIYPVIIEYNPIIQLTPPPLFTN